MHMERYKRFWAVYEASGDLLCVCVYKKGAQAVLGRLRPSGETPTLPASARRASAVRTRKETYHVSPCKPA
jgi:hypothetical protein